MAERGDGRPAPLCECRPHVSVAESYGERRARTATRNAVSRTRASSRSPDGARRAPYRAECRSPTNAAVERVQLGRERRSPRWTIDGRVRPSRTSAPCATASALSRRAGVRARSKRPSGPRAPRRGRAPDRAPARRGRRELGLSAALVGGCVGPGFGAASSSAASPRRVGLRPSAPRRGPAGRSPQHGARDRQLVAGFLHVAQGTDQIALHERRRSRGCAAPWAPRREAGPSKSRMAAAKSAAARHRPLLEEHAAAVQVGARLLLRPGRRGNRWPRRTT